jgi:serine/threonine-protein kinase
MAQQAQSAGVCRDTDVPAVGSYRLLRRIGEGGMSTVYLSFDVARGAPVAVKLLADHLAHSKEFVGRFYREARLSRLLSHKNLVQGLAAGFDPDSSKHFLILEYVDGPSAQSILVRDGSLSPSAVVKIGLDIAEALSFLHDRDYVHRDVKPDNILLHPDGMAKLADLGLAKRLRDDSSLTALNNGVGTSYYMSYEQSLNANFVDGRSDLFALGATLYHLLCGDVPFPGATHEEINRGKKKDVFTPLRERSTTIPASLARVLERTLARDPRSRYESVREFADALRATGLAGSLPPFEGVEDTSRSDGQMGSSNAPTRADLRTPPSNDDTAPVHQSFTRA